MHRGERYWIKEIILASSPNLHFLPKSMHFFLGLQMGKLVMWKCIDFLRKSYDSETPMVSGNLRGLDDLRLRSTPIRRKCIDFLRKSYDSGTPMVSGNLRGLEDLRLRSTPIRRVNMYCFP